MHVTFLVHSRLYSRPLGIVPGRLESLRDIIIYFSYHIYSIKLNNVGFTLVHGAT